MSNHAYNVGAQHAQQGLGPANTHGWNSFAAEKYNAGYNQNK